MNPRPAPDFRAPPQFWRKFYRAEDPHYWYFENLEDPNERGYDAIRRLFLIEMTKVTSRLN